MCAQELLTCCLLTKLHVTFSLQPISLLFDMIDLHVKQCGPFIGRECLNLKGPKTEKMHKLSLTNMECCSESGFHDMVANPKDSLCIVGIFKLTSLSGRLEMNDSSTFYSPEGNQETTQNPQGGVIRTYGRFER